MKKFLALLFVCAGLTAMAVTPRVNMNAQVRDGKPVKNMVMKSNTLANQFTAPVMKAKVTKDVMTPQRLFEEKGITPDQNKLMKKAPRRVSADDVMATKLGFMLSYVYDETEGIVIADDYLFGGWTVEMEQQGDDQFNAYLYFTGIPFTINVDYSANTAEMVMETLGGWHWIDTVTSGNSTVYNDTTEYLALWDEAYVLSEDANAEPTNLQGTLYNDGSLYFPDGWTLYLVDYVKKTTIRNGRTQITYDTVAGLLCDFMHSTYLLTANANHEYTSSSTGNTNNATAYMFQYDDTTAIAWNLWGMGNRGVEFYIHEDGSMFLPSYQVVYTEDIADYAAQYTQYDWSEGYQFFVFGMDVDEDGNPIDDTENEDGQAGTVDANGIYWPVSAIYDLIGANGNWYFGLGFYPFINNKLTFTNPEEDWFMLGVTADPVINYTVNDENVVITLGLEEGAEYLMTVDGEYVESPYTIARTHEDQVVTVMAVAQVYGKQMSNVVSQEITIPALEIENLYILGEVNDQNWACDAGYPMTLADGVFTATVTFDGRNAEDDGNVNYFSFTAKLADSWDAIAPYRLQPVSEGNFWWNEGYNGQALDVEWISADRAYRVPAGEYDIVVDLANMKCTITKKAVIPVTLRGDLNADGNVNTGDLSALITALLNNDMSQIDMDADPSMDGQINTGDISALISYLLNGVWD